MIDKEYTPKEVAEICRVKTITVWLWINAGKLQARVQNGKYRVSEEQLKQFLTEK